MFNRPQSYPELTLYKDFSMTSQAIGILHPGEMGISIAASAQNSGYSVHWASEGRSVSTHARAAQFNLRDARTLAQLCETCAVIISVCPPHAAEAQAQQVLRHTFRGLYIDANAIAPQRAIRIGEAMRAAGATFVDGGIIGGPAWARGKTRLYLSGAHAPQAAAYFSAGPLETCVLDDEIGKASALKMCYAAHTKGATALLCAILAAAETLGVRDALQQEWARSDQELATHAEARVRRVTAKAWRFVGEMEEIAATFEAAGVPSEFHEAAATVYHRLASFKDANTLPSLEAVLATLLQSSASHFDYRR
jgi:3-hydroxyisobutyrate dehydrogenase-like beta-hydroxyacid dehydrogenase